MKPPTLSQREKTILVAMQEGQKVAYMPYQGRFNPRAYYTMPTVSQCTREITKLIKLKLVDHKTVGFSKAEISLTDAGRAFTCELDEPSDIWIMETDWQVRVCKQRGFFKGKTLVTSNGESIRASDKRFFFLSRDEAYDRAILHLENVVGSKKAELHSAEKKLQNIIKEKNTPQ